jgi:hypothetical protein
VSRAQGRRGRRGLRGWFALSGSLAAGLAAVLLAASSAWGAVAIQAGTAQLQWAPASGPVAGYNVQVSRNGAAWSQLQRVFQPTIIVALPTGTTARIRVAAFDAQGNTGPWSVASVTFQFATSGGGGSSASGSGGPPATAPPVARFDLNGDGYDDLVWQNTTDGSYHVWFMRGAQRSGQATLLRPADPAAHIAGIADFDNDGRNDLLYFDSLTGAMWVATKGGVSGKLVTIPSAPPGWDVAAVGQFDGYGSADVLMRNMSTGNDALWQFGPKLSVEHWNLPQVGPQWTIAAALDYDGDGTTDIFWREAGSGSDVVWRIVRGNVVQWFSVASVGSSWAVAAVGDFDGDGRDDLLWRAASAGSDVVWFGARGTPFRRQTPSWPVDGSWQVVGTADVDGNGTSDLLWNRSQAGQNVAFLMNGSAVNTSSILPTAPAAWEPVPPLARP